MKLVHLDNYQIVAEDELLLLQPFKKLYKSDKTRSKDNFYTFLSIVYFTYDPRSDYNYIINEQERLKEVCISNGLPEPKFTDLELECVELYKKLTTTSSLELLKSTRIAIDKVREFLETVDLKALDDKGKPVYTINSITTAIKQIPQLAKDLQEAEKAIAQEIQEQNNARGGEEKLSVMDNGLFI